MYVRVQAHTCSVPGNSGGLCLSPKDFPLLRDCSFTDQSSGDWVMGEQ